ncbi:MAG: MarR family transcriptional regulator [Clostridia bacterium]|nr:MarR family transcriptional regulator [Clostridia bacterium]
MSSLQEQKAFLEAMLRLGKPNLAQFHIRGGGLTRGEYFMLNMISEHARRFPQAKGMYVSELAELMQVTPPAVSRMLRGLEHKDYIERVVDREDRRTTYIVLRPKGDAERRELERRALAFSDRIIDQLGEEDTATLLRIWNRLADIFAEEQAKGI